MVGPRDHKNARKGPALPKRRTKSFFRNQRAAILKRRPGSSLKSQWSLGALAHAHRHLTVPA